MRGTLVCNNSLLPKILATFSPSQWMSFTKRMSATNTVCVYYTRNIRTHTIRIRWSQMRSWRDRSRGPTKYPRLRESHRQWGFMPVKEPRGRYCTVRWHLGKIPAVGTESHNAGGWNREWWGEFHRFLFGAILGEFGRNLLWCWHPACFATLWGWISWYWEITVVGIGRGKSISCREFRG